MKNRISILLAILVSGLMAVGGRVHAQSIIVNELYNSNLSTDEWVELLVVQDSLDLRGYTLHDNTNTLTFSTNSLWSSVSKGTIIVIGQSGLLTAEDTDPSDYLLVIKGTNGIYFSGTPFLFGGSGDFIQIKNASNAHVFSVSWVTASPGSPDTHFTSAFTSNRTIFFNGNDVSQLTTISNWTANSTTLTQGVGNTATNIAWISSLRANTTGDGSGTASVGPDTLTHGVSYDLNITYRRDTAFTITDMRVIIPGNFLWSRSTSDVSYTNMTATNSVSSDTVYFNALSISADSTVITLHSVTAPDSTAYYSLRVQSKALNNYANVAPSPQLTVFGVAVTIAEAKGNDANGVPLRLGQLVTIRGVVTVANEFGGPSYLQDNTAGIAIFGSALSTAVSIGDEVIVTGKVDPFNGLMELTSPYVHSIPSTGNTVTPTVVTCSQVAGDGVGGLETYEGLLIRINATVVRDTFNNPIASWTVAGSGTNYRLTDASGNLDIRVDNGVNFANTPAPQGAFDVIGVVSQFKTASPFIGGYQLMPRASTDILAQGPIIASLPVESNITSSSMTISWTTVNNGTTRLRYGTTTTYELGVIEPDNTLRTNHSVNMSGLLAANIYHVLAFSVANGDTSAASDLVVSTASPLSTTGQINVYFNKSVNTSVSSGELALGNQDLVSRVLTRIDNARYSIDACLYSLSGASEGTVIANALISAKGRGVKVRVICENDNKTSSAFASLQSNGIPLVADTYDLVWAGQGLMHNKFYVIDYRGGAPESVWVWSGSWNATDQGTNSDRQNSIEIQDVALGGAYTAEFNEMWGSSTDTPNQTNSRFGGRKSDNTPHHFMVNGVPVEMYFSPSDKTTSHIRSTLGLAQHSISNAILTFTRKDLADTLIGRKNAGKKVRVVLDNNTDTGNQYAYLQSNGVDIHLKGGSGLLHHKYATVDADQIGGDQYAITGSHNWSNSAENSNDENTLIVDNGRVANFYLQEFAARYYEAGGTDSIHVGSAPLFSVTPSSLNFGSVNGGESKQDSVTVSNPGNLSLTVSAVTSSNARFSVSPLNATIAPLNSQKFYVTFSPLASGGQSGSIVFTHNAVGSPDTVAVQGTGVNAGELSVAVHVNKGWNMVSNPVLNDPRVDSVFPGARRISIAFRYSSGYVQSDSLKHGVGYWLKFGVDTTYTVIGSAVPVDTFHLVTGWNLIGSITYPAAVGSIVENPSGLVQTNYFGYNGGYGIADSILPGNGYWVKTNQVGDLIVSASGPIISQKASIALPSLNQLTVSDALDHQQTLHFGIGKPDEALMSRFEMPPLPPEDAFDVRFASNSLLEIVEPVTVGRRDIAIGVQALSYPLSVKWDVSSAGTPYYTLRMTSSSGERKIELLGSGEAVLSEREAKHLVLSASSKREVPTSFFLGQNYPNPFNPTTTIPLALPRNAVVTMTIFNTLGQTVKTVYDREHLDAGYYEIPFNASQLSSGVYYFRVTVVDDKDVRYTDTKKFALIR